MDNGFKSFVIGALVAGAIAGGLYYSSQGFSHHGSNPRPSRYCTCEPDCNCSDPCECGRELREKLIDGRELNFRDLPDASVLYPKELGNGWHTFELDLNGRRRTFLYRRGGYLVELESKASPLRPGAVGDAPPAATGTK